MAWVGVEGLPVPGEADTLTQGLTAEGEANTCSHAQARIHSHPRTCISSGRGRGCVYPPHSCIEGGRRGSRTCRGHHAPLAPALALVAPPPAHCLGDGSLQQETHCVMKIMDIVMPDQL